MSNFIVNALKGLPMPIYGDGSQTRSFCYIDDLVDGLVSMMSTSSDVTGPINLGNPSEFTIAELADILMSLIPTAATVSYHPLPTDDPIRRQPNIDRARSTLGWEPTVDLRAGLARTIAYFQELVA